MTDLPFVLLAPDRLERVEAWGMSRASLAYVHRPTTEAHARRVLQEAQERGVTVAARGGGNSYGDASLNADGVILDLTRMNRILAWDPDTGRIECEPGVTIRQLWQHCLEDGWWPPVVSGTMHVTLGGALGTNIHGKNNFHAGPIGDHITEFDLLLPGSGEVKTCRRDTEPELFHAAIGGLGLLGIVTRIALQMKRVHSGLLRVEAFSTRNLAELFQQFETRRHEADYLVGWIDCFASGDALGRALVHQANYLRPGEDHEPAQTLRVVNQELPDTLFGLVPKSVMGRALQPFTNNIGMKMINQAKYTEGSTLGNNKTVLQPHAQFAFLLDYVPNWKYAYKPGAMTQFQSFVPEGHAESVFRQQIALSQKARILPYLGVFKRHRPDAFLLTHAVDGYSLALDYPLNNANEPGLRVLAERMAQLVVEHGGRFYFAKDSLLSPRLTRQFLGEAALEKFAALKQQCDPNWTLQSELFRRVLPHLAVSRSKSFDSVCLNEGNTS